MQLQGYHKSASHSQQHLSFFFPFHILFVASSFTTNERRLVSKDILFETFKLEITLFYTVDLKYNYVPKCCLLEK